MRTILLMPAFNEAENILPVIREVRALHPWLDLAVIDDGSGDATARLAEGCGVRVLRLPFNLGYGAAVQAGLLYALQAGYEACVLFDADGQHDPKYIAALLEPVLKGEADLALGSRFLGNADYRVPVNRRIGMYLFSRIASLITSQHITDPTSGFQAMGRNLTRFFAQGNYPADYPDADTIIRLYYAGFRIQEIPVRVRARLCGRSMHSPLKSLYYIYKMFLSIFVALFERRELAEGGRHAVRDQDPDSRYEFVDPAGHH